MHDDGDWDSELAVDLMGLGRGWGLVLTTALALGLLAWHLWS